jgi:hypothetical protein
MAAEDGRVMESNLKESADNFKGRSLIGGRY